MDNKDNQEKKPLSDTKKYSLLALAAALLIGAYFVGGSIDINQTYNNQAIAKPMNSQDPSQHTDHAYKKGDIITGDFNKRFDSDYIQGDLSKTPKVTLIEYGSMTCPHCAKFHKAALFPIKDAYINTQKIQYIYRDYPLDGAALKASLLARCDITKRTAFIDLLYKKQAEWTRAKSLADIEKNLITIGKMGGLSTDMITKCFADKALTESILNVQKSSSQLFDITATPTIIINNKKFTGGLEPKALKHTLDTLLKADTEKNKQ